VNDELVAAAELGDEAKRFLESDLGRCILGIAKQEAELANDKYKAVDPEDAKAIRAIQNEVWRAESFEQWLLELFSRGENALQAFIQQRGSE
jgi:fumarate hydratase class II